MSPFKLTYSCFIGLEDFTTLHISDDYSIEPDSKRINNKVAVTIKPGDMIIMTSNCLHAGAEYSGVVDCSPSTPYDPAYSSHYRGFIEISTSLAPIDNNSQYWFFETDNQYLKDQKKHGWVTSPPLYYREPNRIEEESGKGDACNKDKADNEDDEDESKEYDPKDYQHLVDTIHFDEDERVRYKVTRVYTFKGLVAVDRVLFDRNNSDPSQSSSIDTVNLLDVLNYPILQDSLNVDERDSSSSSKIQKVPDVSSSSSSSSSSSPDKNKIKKIPKTSHIDRIDGGYIYYSFPIN